RMDLPAADREVDPLQDFLAADLDLQVLDLEHPHSLPRPGRAQPTVPSRFRLTLISFWASTANSIGSFRKTCLQKPLTIMFVASSGVMPRVWQLKSCSSPIFEVDASCSICAVGSWTWMSGNVKAAHVDPIRRESHWESVRAFEAPLEIWRG